MIKMTTTTLILLVLIGLLAGIFSGLVGIGGALVIIPGLVFVAIAQISTRPREPASLSCCRQLACWLPTITTKPAPSI